jgi:hypothetical protein
MTKPLLTRARKPRSGAGSRSLSVSPERETASELRRPDVATPITVARLMNDDRNLVEIEANARRASERYRLYRAKVLGPRPTSPGRLRELQRESERAEARLAGARAPRS